MVVGLTGGIGSGKTTVANGFSKLGVPVIDADQLAHELVEPGQIALDEIISTFGPEALTTDGRLDRNYMRQQIFSDPVRKSRLEAILHPKIRQHIRALLSDIRAPYCILVIPLLLETRQTDLVDRILVIDSPEKEQLIRVAARDRLSDNAIMAIMASQADRNTRLAAADDIIVNDQDITALTCHIQELHKHYMGITHDH
ncbi:MAG: dephospho-CoA kinase [Gammaproteobacteria bacterium]|nr:MAG: dephospho-CoA kinase [Gammaproteobacteria bacterium]